MVSTEQKTLSYSLPLSQPALATEARPQPTVLGEPGLPLHTAKAGILL
jgi:hypothetical protein